MQEQLPRMARNESVFKPATLQVILEYPLHLVRQYPAFLGQRSTGSFRSIKGPGNRSQRLSRIC